MTIFELDRTSLEALARLLQHEGLSFREQVHLARLDPQSDFFRVDLSGIDLSGEDLRGFEFCEVNFSGSNLSNVIYDESTSFEDCCFEGAVVDAALSEIIREGPRMARSRDLLPYDTLLLYLAGQRFRAVHAANKYIDLRVKREFTDSKRLSWSVISSSLNCDVHSTANTNLNEIALARCDELVKQDSATWLPIKAIILNQLRINYIARVDDRREFIEAELVRVYSMLRSDLSEGYGRAFYISLCRYARGYSESDFRAKLAAIDIFARVLPEMGSLIDQSADIRYEYYLSLLTYTNMIWRLGLLPAASFLAAQGMASMRELSEKLVIEESIRRVGMGFDQVRLWTIENQNVPISSSAIVNRLARFIDDKDVINNTEHPMVTGMINFFCLRAEMDMAKRNNVGDYIEAIESMHAIRKRIGGWWWMDDELVSLKAVGEELLVDFNTLCELMRATTTASEGWRTVLWKGGGIDANWVSNLRPVGPAWG
jgi:hypothetical protein